MNWMKLATNDLLDDLFTNTPRREEVSTDPPTRKPLTLMLYRGFDVDLNQLQKSGNGYILSPHRSQQGAMWFTHQFISGYDPIQYVSGRGSHLLTYPLQCFKHRQVVHYNDGSTYEQIPDNIIAQTTPSENCRFYMGIELPEGWMFSYKMEKFIICTIPITVTPDMIKPNTGEME